MNFSDLHDQFCVACSNVGIVKIFVEMTKELKDAISHNVKFVVRRSLLHTSFSLGTLSSPLPLHNEFDFKPQMTNF